MEHDSSINLFIAAAGLGTRLQPLTNAFPKPLLPVAGVPVAERLLHSVLASLKIRNVAMNLHYKPEHFLRWAKKLKPDLPQPKFYLEEELLGTGGAIANAHEFFRQGTCLLINGDILTDIDWKGLVEHHQRSGNMVTLAVQDRAHERRVGVDAKGKLLVIDKEMKTPGVDRWLGYACAAIYEPAFLDYLPEGESHVPPFWVKAAKQTNSIGTYDIGSSPWIDLGNVSSYVEGVDSYLTGSERYFAEPLNIPWDTQIDGTCLIENNVVIGSGVELRNAILLPGAIIEDGEILDSIIAGPDIREPFSLPAHGERPKDNKPALSGSDRIYSHVSDGLLLQYTASESMVDRQISLTQILRCEGVPVPEVYCHHPAKRQVLLEDLGKESLRSWCQSRPTNEIIHMLKQVLDRLVDFQWAETTGSPYPMDMPFDKSVLLWESSYFMERCVYRVFGLHDFCQQHKVALEREFEQLADSVAMLPRNLMHRDFQSSNVMIFQDEPWFIDFQAARHGPSFYDAASMIGDPYLHLPLHLRRELEIYYLEIVSKRLKMTLDDSRNALILCGMQRHMQALGAYGFLSSIRGKNEFLQYISPALELLSEEVSNLKTQFPALNNLVEKLLSVSGG